MNEGGKNIEPGVWQRLKQGDIHALELLFNRYFDELYYYALKLCGNPTVAEDQIQELFLKIWQRREGLGDVSNIKAYLLTVLRRNILSKMKDQRTKLYLVDEHNKPEQEFRIELSAEEMVISNELVDERKKRLEQAIEQLSARHKEALILKYYNGMSYREIEEIMSVNYQTARNYVYEALEALREIMDSSLSTTTLKPRHDIWMLFFFVLVG